MQRHRLYKVVTFFIRHPPASPRLPLPVDRHKLETLEGVCWVVDEGSQLNVTTRSKLPMGDERWRGPHITSGTWRCAPRLWYVIQISVEDVW